MRTLPLVLVGALLVAACSDRPAKPPPLGEVLPALPVPPESRIIGRHGSADALQFTFESVAPLPLMLEYYRGMFSHAPWNLVSDEVDQDGVHVLYAERDGPPMWVRIWRGTDSTRTLVEIAGAITAEAAARDSAARRLPAQDTAPAR